MSPRGRNLRAVITVKATIETTPPDGTTPGPDHRTDTLTIQGHTHLDAFAKARDAVPDGWRLVHVRTT